MLADDSLGLFVVATPNDTHYALAKEILSAGKNVVVDKPMTMTSAEAAELIGLAKKHKVLLAPFHNRRWDSDFLTVQKLLHEGALGRLVSFESRFDRWRPARLTERLWKEDVDAGGMLLDLGPHLVDQALVLFGKPEGGERRSAARKRWSRTQRFLHHPLALPRSDRHCRVQSALA